MLRLGASLVPACGALVLRAAPDGKGGAPSLEGALQQAQRRRSEEPVEVHLDPGLYQLEAPLAFGSGAFPLTLRGSAGTRLSGGVRVDGWSRDAERAWLWRAPAPAGVGQLSQLWVNDERRLPARSETMQWDSIGPAGDSMTYIVAKEGQLLPSYANASALRVIKYEHWTASAHTVASVEGATINLALPTPSRWTDDDDSGRRYYLENAPEYLQENSGFFFHDEVSAEVLYAPTAAELSGGAFQEEVWAPRLVELVRSQDASGIHLRDVTFAHAAVDWSSCFSADCGAQSASFLGTAALHWENSRDISLVNVTVAHTGGYGVWFAGGVSDVVMERSTVRDVGAGAIRIGEAIGGAAPAARLTHNVTVSDSTLTDGGHVFREGCGVLLQAATGSAIRHNEIARFRYTGVSLGWTWQYVPTTESNNAVEFNHIHTIGMGDLSDLGCVYHLGMDPGTRIVNNICHDVSSYSYGGWAFYTDQASRFVTLRDNIGYDTKCGGFHQHYGLDNVIENNIFYNVNREGCDAAIRSSAHDNGDEGDRSSFVFRKNVVVWKEGPLFGGTSKNGFANETVADNVYWRLSDEPITFPCPKDDPVEGKSFLPDGQRLSSDHSMPSDSQTAWLSMQSDGNLCVYARGASAATWCSMQTRPGAGPFHLGMQGDGNLCVHDASESVVWCANTEAFPTGHYFAQISDDCSFCVYEGSHPDTSKPIWCGSQGPCKKELGDFPSDCSLDSWRQRGQDLKSQIADPLLNDPERGDFSLRAGSPALAMGFKQIDTSSVGPRPTASEVVV